MSPQYNTSRSRVLYFEYRDDGASVPNWMAYSEDVHVPCEEAGP